MADVAVVGAGLGGLATAARLAKLGHRVTVYERSDAPGGLLRRVRDGGFEWDATPMQTTVPAVLRDLFRKSGRPIERYVDLDLSTPARRHVFVDGTTLDLPTGSRGAQFDAVSGSLGAEAAAAWTTFVDGQAAGWEALRAEVLDHPSGASHLGDRRLGRKLRTRLSLDRLLRKELRDERLRLTARYPVERVGGNPLAEPALRAVESYVERTFGVWRAPGGAADLADALMRRMTERSVDVRFGTRVTAVCADAGRVTGVVIDDHRAQAADVVVTAVSPREVFDRLLDRPPPDARRALEPSAGAVRRSHTYLGLNGDLPSLPAEVVLHGDPLVVVSTDAVGSAGSSAWTVTAHGPTSRDVLDTAAERGLDVRHLVAIRCERRIPEPLRWQGPRTAAERAALARPLPGLHCLGVGLVLGSSIPYVAWQAAHVAELIGRA